jgi:putative ABC transport system permease protein
VVPANFDSKLFTVAAAPENQGEALFSAISALVGFMFALNAMLITVPARRMLIEDVRPQGASRLMTVQILLFDAAVLGVLACVIGLALGDLLSVAVFRSTPGYLSSAFPVGNDRIVTWQSAVLAIAAGIVAAAIGVLWPMRDILMRPLQGEERSVRSSPGWIAARLIGGLLCLAVTTVIVIDRPQDAILGNITLVFALVCLLPFLFDAIVITFERVQRLFNAASTILAVTELQTPPTRVRSLAIAATGAIAVFGIVAIQGAQQNLTRGLDASARAIGGNASVWVSPGGESSVLGTAPFEDVNSSALTRLPGVAALGFYRGSFLNWGDRRLWILAPSSSGRQPVPPGQLVDGSLALATARVREGGWAVISQALASEHHLHVGQAFTLPSPRPISLRVAALSKNLGWPPGAIIMNSRQYARAWASDEPSAYEIQLMPGASPDAVKSEIQRTLGSQTGLKVETAAGREHRDYSLVSQGLSRLTQIRLLVLIAAVLAVAGAMGATIWQRRDLVAFIKCQGYARGVLWRWLCCESALLLGAGCLIGAVFGLYGQLLISHALASVTGFPVLFNVGALIALSSFALVCALAVSIVAMAGFLVVRVPPKAVSPAY